MSELEDIKLKAFLQNMELESPKANFSVQVMNKIFKEENALEKIKSERILGKGFWIISILFVMLLAVIFIMNSAGIQTDGEAQKLLPEIGKGVSENYQSFFTKVDTLPLSIAGILIAASILLFIDRLISSNSKIFA